MSIIYHTKNLIRLPHNFYLFGYGANNVENLAKRFFRNINEPGTYSEINLIKENSSPGIIKGWKRIFFGHSNNWEGSVASIRESEGNEVYGVLTKISRIDEKFYIDKKEINLRGLFGVESVDNGMYWFQPISKIDNLYVYAFIGNVSKYPARKAPSKKYLDAIRETLRYATGKQEKYIDIPIEYE